MPSAPAMVRTPTPSDRPPVGEKRVTPPGYCSPVTPVDPSRGEPERHPLRVVRFGVSARDELGRTITAVKAGDPLGAVTVVVPSSHAGVTLRRALAEADGLVNVQFVSLPQVAGGLAAPLLATELR